MLTTEMKHKESITGPKARKTKKTGKPESVPAPRIFCYDDYREYLSDWFSHKKTESQNYSGALFAKHAGLAAHTLLGMVIRGERNLGNETVMGFSRALELSPREALFFEKLVFFNQARGPEDKAFYLSQLTTLAQGDGKKLFTKINNHASYLSRWYVVALRELVNTAGFKPDANWIAARLKNKITRKQAADAWRILCELQMVEPDPSAAGKWLVKHPALDIDPGHVDFAIRTFHKDFMQRTRDAIDNEPLEDRELSSLTMSLPEEDLPALRMAIKDFRRNLNMMFPQTHDAPRTHVVALNAQLLILTNVNKPQGKNNHKPKKEKGEVII